MAEFNKDAQLDTSQIDDQRGRRGGMSAIPGGGLTIGGGGLGLLVLIISVLLGGNPLNQGGGSSAPGGFGSLNNNTTEGQPAGNIAQQCRTGADANQREDCRIVGYVNSVQAYWQQAFAQQGRSYANARTRFFSGSTQTGCGPATSEVGPFYCPPDRMVYIDLGFFDELRTRFGATGGSFAQGYVIAHEYGHHVQNLLGQLDSGSRDTGPQSQAVRSELQADCYAGVWAANAVQTGILSKLTDADIQDGLNAAAAVGDDRIQKAAQGRVNPEKWTHGSAEQRQSWFTTGYQSSDPARCDTSRGQV